MIRPPPRSPLFPSTTLSRSLISALYMLAPCLRFLACVDFVERDVDLVAPPIPHQEPAVLPLEDGDLVPAPKRHLRSEEHTSELQSQSNLVCRLLLEKKNKIL